VKIDRQQLATRGQQGYVVTDCQGGVPQAVLDQIRDLEATTRLTVLEA
jgi:D-3-phosphoglycerate dehydrogenase